MTGKPLSGLFIAEGTSDLPLSDIVEFLFAERGQSLRLSKPDFDALKKVRKDVESKLIAGAQLTGKPFDLAVIHRDADNAGWQARLSEVQSAVLSSGVPCELIPVIPIRMTEAWLLLDESEIRKVAGNPNGRENLGLPKIREVEGIADPKGLLRDCLMKAASVRGRKRQTAATRFPQHRRQLLERLDLQGPVAQLSSWKKLVSDINRFVDSLSA
ncbi:hypothetical protein AB0B89_18840 [Sphaerisporangium sp. NPDC049002]|uniref:hypothetical protein n=1 Tax=unclassified Sphaerisporangium TaxID=2630420 RepID=UPI0033E887AA